MPLKLTICLAYLSANYKTSSGVDEALHRMDLKVDQMDPNTNWWPSSTAANGAFFFCSCSVCLCVSMQIPCGLMTISMQVNAMHFYLCPFISILFVDRSCIKNTRFRTWILNRNMIFYSSYVQNIAKSLFPWLSFSLHTQTITA